MVRKGSGVMIVDTGTTSAFESHVLPYLKAKGITRIDLCVISTHADHAGGLPALARNGRWACGRDSRLPG